MFPMMGNGFGPGGSFMGNLDFLLITLIILKKEVKEKRSSKADKEKTMTNSMTASEQGCSSLAIKE